MKEGIFYGKAKKFFRPINLNCFNCKLSFYNKQWTYFIEIKYI